MSRRKDMWILSKGAVRPLGEQLKCTEEIEERRVTVNVIIVYYVL